MDIVIDVAAPLAVAAARPWRTEARPRRLPPPETSRRSIVQWQRRLVCSSMNQRLRRKNEVGMKNGSNVRPAIPIVLPLLITLLSEVSHKLRRRHTTPPDPAF